MTIAIAILFLLVTMLSLLNVRSFRAFNVPAVATSTNRILTHSRRALTMEAEKATIKRMTVLQFGDILKSESRSLYQIVDVREPNELAVASIAGVYLLHHPSPRPTLLYICTFDVLSRFPNVFCYKARTSSIFPWATPLRGHRK